VILNGEDEQRNAQYYMMKMNSSK